MAYKFEKYSIGGGSASAIIDVTVLPSEDINGEALYRLMVDGTPKLYFHGADGWIEVGKPPSDGSFNPFKYRAENYNSLSYAFYGKYKTGESGDYPYTTYIDDYVAQCLDGIDLSTVENFNIECMFQTDSNSDGKQGISYVPMALRVGNHFYRAQYALAQTCITEFDNYFTVYDGKGLFYECRQLTHAVYDAGDTVRCDEMFKNCYSLTECTIKNFGQCDSRGNFDGMYQESSTKSLFSGCSKLTKVTFENCGQTFTNFSGMFTNCSSLLEAPASLDTSKVQTLEYLFNGCVCLKTVPAYDTGSATSMFGMFNNCSSLTMVPSLNTSSVKNMYYMFYNCYSLTDVPMLDMRAVTSATSMFQNCTSLTNITLKNINTNLQVGSGTSYGHLITVDSLIGLIYELRTQTSQKTLTVGTANLAKLTDVYVKLIDITDDMRAEDDLIDEKKPFVVCESTDEGAMLIGDYVLTKNWKLA